MKKCIPVIAVVLLISAILGYVINKTEEVETSTLVINEVCSRNASISLEDDFLGDDYIEIYNTTNEIINLNGWYLSDDGENLQKQSLPAVSIEPKSYKIFYANGKEGDQTLNFKVSLEGEEIFLTSPEGKVVDQVYVPKLVMDTVYARTKDGSSDWAVMAPSPQSTNNNALLSKNVVLDGPVFSHKSGFYEDEFMLKLSTKKDQTVYYTMDGSVPNENSFVYDDGIKISKSSEEKSILNSLQRVVLDWKDYSPTYEMTDKATVIRAIAVDKKGNISEVVTATYFVGLEQYKGKIVLSIVAEPEQLIGENGILVTGTEYDNWYMTDAMASDGLYEEYRSENYETANFFGHGRKYEVLSEIQLFENGKISLEQIAGVKVQGNTTRLEPKKSLQIVSRSAYSGNSVFQQQLFGSYDSHAFYAVKNREKAYCMKLSEDRNLGIQAAKECAVFVNGEYWYTAAIMEKYDETYFEQHYHVDSENVLMIKDTVAEVGEEYQYIYDDLINYLRDESISQEEKGLYLYEQIDVQSIIDWLCLNLYLGNDDVSYKKNSVLWRTLQPEANPYGDCRWRWNVYDIDHAAVGAKPESDDFSDFSIISDNRFYWALCTVPHFRQQFVLTAMDMMNTNLSSENVERVLAEWGLDCSYSDNYFLKRPEYMIQSLRNEFDLAGTVETVVLDTNNIEAGNIYINTVQVDLSDGAWEGKYFTDYPVTVTAVSNPGYEFVGWSGDEESQENSINIYLEEGGTTLTAVFKEKK